MFNVSVIDNQKIKIRSCPFCGHTADFYTYDTDENDGRVSLYFTIRCQSITKCGAQAPQGGRFEIRLNSDGKIEVLKDDRQRIADMWNGKAKEE